MSGRQEKKSIIRLLKFDVDESLDPKTLFQGAKLTLRETGGKKLSMNDK